MSLKKIQLVFVLGLFGLGLSACGDSDSGSSDKSQSVISESAAPAVMEESAMPENSGAKEAPAEVVAETTQEDTSSESTTEDGLEAYDPDVPSVMVEDNGVVHEEAIYKAWPKQTAASDDSMSTPAAIAPAGKTHVVMGQATSFNPKILFINPGDTVQWQNMTIHDSVSMEGLIPDGAEPWKFNIGQNGAVTLTEEGVYIYKCNPHYPNGMAAAIIVGKPVNIAQIQTNATGRSKGVVFKVVKALATR